MAQGSSMYQQHIQCLEVRKYSLTEEKPLSRTEELSNNWYRVLSVQTIHVDSASHDRVTWETS